MNMYVDGVTVEWNERRRSDLNTLKEKQERRKQKRDKTARRMKGLRLKKNGTERDSWNEKRRARVMPTETETETGEVNASEGTMRTTR